MSWALVLFWPTPGPKSIDSLIEGLRASGNGSASTTLPTRTSTFSKSSHAISGKPPPSREFSYLEELPYDVQVEVSRQGVSAPPSTNGTPHLHIRIAGGEREVHFEAAAVG